MILIHGSPGVRLGFINAFLTDKLQHDMYDVGQQIPLYKFHTYNEEKIREFKGKKIYIKLSNDLLFLHMFLFFEKNILTQIPEFQNFHYTHRNLFDKFYYSSKMWFENEKINNFTLYDHIIPFEKTYDIDYLVKLYKEFNGTPPSDVLLESAKSTNKKNFPDIPKNHAARVAALVFNFEYKNNFTDKDRRWAINEIAPFEHNSGECLDPNNFFDNVNNQLKVENYR